MGSVDGTGLPPITDPVSIDGTTQPGWLGPPVIRVDNAATTTPSNGLELDAGAAGTALHGTGSTITALALTRFGSPFKSGILVGADYATITGSYVGTDNNGDDLLGNATGITVDASNVTVGGTTQSDRNVVSGNHTAGIELAGGSGIVLAGNYVGSGPGGLTGLTNDGDGIRVDAGVSSPTIGGDNSGIGSGTCDGACNLVGANDGAGISMTSATGINVSGNFIGVERNGTTPLANFVGGIVVSQGTASIGGTTAATGNLVSGIGGDGIAVVDSGPGGPYTPGACCHPGKHRRHGRHRRAHVGQSGQRHPCERHEPGADRGVRIRGGQQRLVELS